MTLWTMTGAELAAACAAPVEIAYPRASHALASVLTDITRLTPADRAALARAFHAARPKPLRQIAQRPTFKGWDDFMPAFTAAREACKAVAGERWYLDPTVALKARVPAAWTCCHLSRGTSVSPRDVTVPRAEFWEGASLPLGPDYAEFGRLDRGRGGTARRRVAPELVLEPTPNGDMDTERLAAD
jgi:hypothetical protein